MVVLGSALAFPGPTVLTVGLPKPYLHVHRACKKALPAVDTLAVLSIFSVSSEQQDASQVTRCRPYCSCSTV